MGKAWCGGQGVVWCVGHGESSQWCGGQGTKAGGAEAALVEVFDQTHGVVVHTLISTSVAHR